MRSNSLLPFGRLATPSSALIGGTCSAGGRPACARRLRCYRFVGARLQSLSTALASRCHQSPAQSPSVAISRHRSPSVAISSHQSPSAQPSLPHPSPHLCAPQPRPAVPRHVHLTSAHIARDGVQAFQTWAEVSAKGHHCLLSVGAVVHALRHRFTRRAINQWIWITKECQRQYRVVSKVRRHLYAHAAATTLTTHATTLTTHPTTTTRPTVSSSPRPGRNTLASHLGASRLRQLGGRCGSSPLSWVGRAHVAARERAPGLQQLARCPNGGFKDSSSGPACRAWLAARRAAVGDERVGPTGARARATTGRPALRAHHATLA